VLKSLLLPQAQNVSAVTFAVSKMKDELRGRNYDKCPHTAEVTGIALCMFVQVDDWPVRDGVW
jgi:hypothetical protein